MQEAIKDCIEPAIKDWLGIATAHLAILVTNSGEQITTESGELLIARN